MSTSHIGSDALTNPVTPITIPGFDVLNPTSYAQTPSTPAPVSLASVANTSTSSASGQNPYQQAAATLQQWQYQTLAQSMEGNLSAATSALYSSAGLNADQFANLASELQNIESSSSTGSTVDTSA